VRVNLTAAWQFLIWTATATVLAVVLGYPALAGASVTEASSSAGPTVQATFQPTTRVSRSTLALTASIMSRRLLSFHVSDSKVTTENGEILVSFPSEEDSQQLLTIIGTRAQLSIRTVLCGAPSFMRNSGSGTSYRHPPTCQAPYRYSSAMFSQDQEMFDPPAKDVVDPAYASYLSTPSSEDAPSENVLLSVGSAGGFAPRYVLGPSLATQAIFKKVYAMKETNGDWIVVTNVTQSASKTFNTIAADDFDRPIAYVLDGQIISAPVILEKSFNGSGEISGNFTERQAEALAVDLGFPALPVSVRRVS